MTALNTYLVGWMGPLGPLFAVGILGIMLILMVLPMLLKKQADPMTKFRNAAKPQSEAVVARGARNKPKKGLRTSQGTDKLDKFADFLEPKTEEEMTTARLRMTRAGYRGKNAVRTFHALQFTLGIFFLILGVGYAIFASATSGISTTKLILAVLAPGGFGYYLPKYWFERLGRVPVELDVASEFRYREAPLRKGDLAIFISQSGETADTLAALRYAKEQGVHTLSVVNVPSSTIARESETVLPTLAGPEIGVASTKAFTCQLMVLAAIEAAGGKARGELSDADEVRMGHGLVEIRRLMAAALATEPKIEKQAGEMSKQKEDR